jgi:hypothetical protein
LVAFSRLAVIGWAVTFALDHLLPLPDAKNSLWFSAVSGGAGRGGGARAFPV